MVSVTTQFKFLAPDGKKRFADVLDSEGVIALAKNFPNNRATKFLDWFLYSDTSIDGQSKKKAYLNNTKANLLTKHQYFLDFGTRFPNNLLYFCQKLFISGKYSSSQTTQIKRSSNHQRRQWAIDRDHSACRLDRKR